MIYSGLHGTYPTLVLNAVLLPLNAWRLHGMTQLIRDIETAAKGDLNAEWLLPYTRPKTFKAGEIMMKRGDYAHGAFFVVTGEVELVELGKTVGPGTLLGEIGLFTPDGLRIATARCKTTVRGRTHRLRSVQAALFPESGIRLPPAASDRRTIAGGPCVAAAFPIVEVSKS